MHQYRANRYVLSKRLKQSALMVRSRMKSGREESSRPWGHQLKRPDSCKCSASSEVLQVADGWRNAGAAEC